MVCPNCRDRQHEKCPGKSWCDCAHRDPQTPPDEALGEEK